MERDQFIQLLKTHQNLIYKVCYLYCREEDNRKDLQQEILIQLWSSFEKYDGRVKESTWIYKIALNTAISFYRKDSRYTQRFIRAEQAVFQLAENTQSSEQLERIKLLYQYIELLNEFDKALILLYLDDHKQKEIAEILGITETNVATKISRIKKQLKDQFTNQR